MEVKLTALVKSAQQEIQHVDDLSHLEALRVQFLGKKGKLTNLLKSLGQLSPEERPKVGQLVNAAKQTLQTTLSQRAAYLRQTILKAKLEREFIDVTLPGRHESLGGLHPVTMASTRAIEYLFRCGFEIAEGPEIEDDYHNFTALNFPQNHPARAMHDTFYFPDKQLLRTHTSTVQIRTMLQRSPPLRIMTPGKVYRCDSDQTHTPMFHQLEGLVVDENCTFTQLKGLLRSFLINFFGEGIGIRFRPSYFPFTEPSAEIDIKLEDSDDWLEVLGCGMVHPNVLENVNIDSERYTGFAFGIGLDRLAMLLYKINDLRKFFEGDLRFLAQF